MAAEDDILVGLQYRGKMSVGDDRQRLGYSAFHWSIIIRTSRYHRFDVTDGIVQDPVTYRNLNVNEDWVYRHLESDTTTEIARYLAAVRIGKLPSTSHFAATIQLIEAVSLPNKNFRREQNCVSWTVDVVRSLQAAKIVDDFDLSEFMDFVLLHGDARISDLKGTEEVIPYPPTAIKCPARVGRLQNILRKIGLR